MGITTCSIIENHQDFDALRMFCDQLNSNPQLTASMQDYDTALRAAGATLIADLATKPWTLELCRSPQDIDPKLVTIGWDAGYLVECHGPFGDVYVYEHLAEISWYMCKWYPFLLEPRYRNPLLQATRVISSLLNPDRSTTSIFVPDSAYDESLALDELRHTMPTVRMWLEHRFGPPSERFEAIVQESEDRMYSSKGYYVAQW